MEETMYDRMRASSNPSSSEPGATESSSEGSVEQSTEQTSTETTSQEGQESSEESKPFDFSGVNEYFKSSFKDENEFRSLLESRDKYQDYESQLTSTQDELKNAQDKLNAMLDYVDPEKAYPNKEAVALSQLAEKYPKADLGIISRIRSADVETMDKLDALVMLDKLTVPSNVSDRVRREEILRGLGIDEEDVSQLTDNDRYRIEREFINRSQTLNEIKEFQPELAKFDLETEMIKRQEQLKQETEVIKGNNEKMLKVLMDGYKDYKVVIKEDGKDRTFTYTVDPKWKEERFNEIVEHYSNAGVKVTTENAKQIMAQIDNTYLFENKANIFNDFAKQLVSSEKDAAHNEIHSDSPTNRTEAPPGQPSPPKTIRESMRTGGFKRK